MQVISVDFFTVPGESEKEFLEQSQIVQTFIKEMAGFVEGFTYSKTDGDSDCNFMTTAVWESEEAFRRAGKAIGAEFRQRGFNPQALFEKLGVKRIRSEYKRVPY